MKIQPTSEYDILFILLGLLMLAMSLRKLQQRVESLYANHIALSKMVYKTSQLPEDVVE